MLVYGALFFLAPQGAGFCFIAVIDLSVLRAEATFIRLSLAEILFIA